MLALVATRLAYVAGAGWFGAGPVGLVVGAASLAFRRLCTSEPCASSVAR